MSEQNMQARRKYPRRQFRKNIGVLFEGGYRVCSAVELGEGGLSFKAPDAAFLRNLLVSDNLEKPGSQIALTFNIGGGAKFIVVRALARNAKRDRDGLSIIGCQFVDLDFEHRREIRNFVTSRGEIFT